MKNLITQKKMITVNYKFTKERRNQKIWLSTGIVSGVGLIIIASTISFAFVAGMYAIFTGGY